MTNTNTTKPTANKPVFRKKLPGGISSAVFENNRDGRTYRSVNLQRNYRDKSGKWVRKGLYLDHHDIPFIIEALNGTWRFLNEFPIGGSNGTEDAAEPAEATETDAMANAEA